MNYTVTISDPKNLIDSDAESKLLIAGTFVIELIGSHVHWEGVMDLEVKIEDNASLPDAYAGIDGLMPSIVQLSPKDGGWMNETIHEAITGVDRFPDRPDVGCTIYLGHDGNIRNYGVPVWIDPDPSRESPPQVPPGHHDFIGILIHEVFHGLGFVWFTNEWQQLIESRDGVDFFVGEKTVELLGEPLPFDEDDDHYGLNDSPTVVDRGLLYTWGNYERNRLDIGRVDLAVLEDLGYTIKTYDGLPLFELADYAPNIVGDDSDNVIYGDYQDNTLDGGGGNDLIEAGAGADLIIGGPGIDSAVFYQERDFYFIDTSRPSELVIRGGTEDPGPDTIREVERLIFDDVGLAFDLDGHAGEAIKVLGAFYGVDGVNNPAQVGDFLQKLDDGMTYEELLHQSLDAVFGDSRDGATLVGHFYRSVVGEDAPDEITNQYAPLVDSGELSPFDLSLIVSEHELNLANIDFVGLSQSGVEFV